MLVLSLKPRGFPEEKLPLNDFLTAFRSLSAGVKRFYSKFSKDCDLGACVLHGCRFSSSFFLVFFFVFLRFATVSRNEALINVFYVILGFLGFLFCFFLKVAIFFIKIAIVLGNEVLKGMFHMILGLLVFLFLLSFKVCDRSKERSFEGYVSHDFRFARVFFLVNFVS